MRRLTQVKCMQGNTSRRDWTWPRTCHKNVQNHVALDLGLNCDCIRKPHWICESSHIKIWLVLATLAAGSKETSKVSNKNDMPPNCKTVPLYTARWLLLAGNYVKSQKHGQGRLSWPDGRLYEVRRPIQVIERCPPTVLQC